MRTWTILSLAVAIPVQAAIRGGLDGGRFWDYSPAQHAAIAAHQAEQELLTRDQHNERNDSHEKGQDEPKASKNSTSSYKYLSNQTEEFFVKSLPDVNFDFGELYSGLIPIDPSNKSEGLFFVFGVKPDEPVDEVTIWLNGGPGCSSLTGFLQENGPISWQPGTHLPAPNAYSWTTLTNVLWVDQPIGTGFSIGTPYATDELDVAESFLKWFKQWQIRFGIKNYKIYLTGESYAGRYVPYISAGMLDAKDPAYYNFSGAIMYDPCIGEFGYGSQVTAYPHVAENANIWNLNKTFMAQLEAAHEDCGYKDFLDKYLTFPPPGHQPETSVGNITSDCDLWDRARGWETNVNPCFNPYMIVDQCPLLFDPLGLAGGLHYVSPGTQIYFSRSDVIEAMHAPPVNWTVCSHIRVFPDSGTGPQFKGDSSPDPIQGVLPQIIEATNRVLVANGDWDFIITTNQTLLSIQNMTWHGAQGFQKQPSTPFVVEQEDITWQPVYLDNYGAPNSGPQGVMGISHYERGLMWVETFQSGHEVPMYQPRAALQHLQWMLGHIDNFD